MNTIWGEKRKEGNSRKGRKEERKESVMGR